MARTPASTLSIGPQIFGPSASVQAAPATPNALRSPRYELFPAAQLQLRSSISEKRIVIREQDGGRVFFGLRGGLGRLYEYNNITLTASLKASISLGYNAYISSCSSSYDGTIIAAAIFEAKTTYSIRYTPGQVRILISISIFNFFDDICWFVVRLQ